MKLAIASTPCPVVSGWIARLLAPLGRRRDVRRRGRADMLSSHTRRDIGLHNMGLGDDARGDPLYGNARRRW
jgi:hypothetical protein